MLRAVILICALAAPQCDRTNALDVLVAPVESALPLACLMLGQEYLARSSLADGMRTKIICVRIE